MPMSATVLPGSENDVITLSTVKTINQVLPRRSRYGPRHWASRTRQERDLPVLAGRAEDPKLNHGTLRNNPLTRGMRLPPGRISIYSRPAQTAGGDTPAVKRGQHGGKDMAIKNNREVISSWVETFNRGDMDAAAEVFADDARNFGRPVGRDAIRRVLKDVQKTFTTPAATISE